MRFACWLRKATQAHSHAHAQASAQMHTHTSAEIYNAYCFPQQQWFRERVSMLRYTCSPMGCKYPSQTGSRWVLKSVKFFSFFLLLAFTTHLRVLASSFLRFLDHTQ
jgi:hypothetical protein